MTRSIAVLLSYAVYLLFPVACVSAVPSGRGAGGLAERLVFGVALYECLLLGLGLALGTAGCLTPPVYRVALGAATLLLGARGFRNGFGTRRVRASRVLRTRRGRVALVLGGLAAVACGVELAFDFLWGTRHGDGLWYHVPRVMFWLGQGSFAPWETPAAASVGLPVGADLVLLHKMLLGLGWAGAGYATAWLAAGASACVYLGGVQLGLGRWRSALAALLFSSFPAVGLRVWSVNSDLAAAFAVLAACAALVRVRSPRGALSGFVLLCAAAAACKPTVALPAAVLGGLALWHCRRKVVAACRSALPYAAAVAGAVLLLAAYWPVYQAFGDFFGGDYTRRHQSAGAGEFLYAVGMHTAYWLLEPLGYLTRFRASWQTEGLRWIYHAVGAHFDRLPDLWKPYPGQDSGYTGPVPVLLLPVLVAGLRRSWRRFAGAALLLAYLPLAGMIRPQPYFTRYNVLLLAGVALVWGGTALFARRRSRWWLAAVVFVNLSALLGIVSINVYLHATAWSREGGPYWYISDRDRATVAASLAGRPLLVLTEASERVMSMDALLPGPQVAFPLRYVVCPPSGDWAEAARRLPAASTWLALVHNGLDTVDADPAVVLPGAARCGEVPKALLEGALCGAGWSRWRQGRYVDLWSHP